MSWPQSKFSQGLTIIQSSNDAYKWCYRHNHRHDLAECPVSFAGSKDGDLAGPDKVLLGPSQVTEQARKAPTESHADPTYLLRVRRRKGEERFKDPWKHTSKASEVHRSSNRRRVMKTLNSGWYPSDRLRL